MQIRTKLIMLLPALIFIGMGAQAQTAYNKIDDIDIGSKMVNYPKVQWLKGTPLTTFEKDKIYIIELWATWCVPCTEAMPHLNRLYQKFKDKGIVFIGQNVMENDLAKVEKFVEQKGDGLSYPIAFAGPKGSDFDKKWLEAAGVTAIPQTFVVQNNVLIWQTHPSNLNEQVLQLMVEGKFTVAAARALDKIR